MNINNFVIVSGSKTGPSVRLKAKTVRELQLEKVKLETENEEIEKKLQQLQSNMRREKEERKKSSAYHWKSGQAGPMTVQARVLSQSKANNSKVSSGKAKLQILKEQVQEPVKEPFKHEMANAVAHEKSEVKGIACGRCEIKSVLLAEADKHVGKLEVHEEKKVNSKHQVTSDKFLFLLASVGGAEEPSSESACIGLDDQDKTLLLNGTFNEEESAKSFQEALLQWRRGDHERREQWRASEVLSESVGTCEVQTNVTVMKDPVQIEFKKDGLSYMEKLLLKKYRRTPGDQISGNCIKGLRPVQTLNVHETETEGWGEDDDDVDDLTVEDVKRYWTSVFREGVPNTVSESAESSLKIEFLDDSYGKDSEESSDDFLVMEARTMGMNKQGKAEPLKQFGSGSAAADQNKTVQDVLQRETVGLMRKSSHHLTSTAYTQYVLPFPLDRNPVSHEEISQEEIVVCSLERNAVQKESTKLKTMRRSFGSSKPPVKISNPTELMSNKYLLETRLQQPDRDSKELDSACSSLILGIITESSMLQDIATRQKPVSAPYLGLEGFFVVGANSKQVMLEAHSSLCADPSPLDSSIPFPGDGRWVTEKSFSECADDSVVQGVLESQLNRPSRALETQNRISPLMAAWRSYPGNDSKRPWSTNTLQSKLAGSCPTNTQPRPKSSPTHTFGAGTKRSEHKCLDVTKQEEYLWEYIADQEALLTLEKELQNCPGPEKHFSLSCEDVTSSSRHARKICENPADFHKNLELKGHSRVDTLGVWDESQMEDEEEILEDKQQVLALQ